MSDIDKQLEEWIASCDCAESFHDNCTTANVIAAALLRARKALLLAESRLFDNAIKPVISKALADPELEESLLGARAP